MSEVQLRDKPLSPQGRVSSGSDRRASANLMENFKYVSDSERKSYCDYINKHLVLTDPIDPESPTSLFDVISEGVVLP